MKPNGHRRRVTRWRDGMAVVCPLCGKGLRRKTRQAKVLRVALQVHLIVVHLELTGRQRSLVCDETMRMRDALTLRCRELLDPAPLVEPQSA